MASKHMQRGRQYLRALARYEKEALAALEQPKTQPENFEMVEAIDPEIKKMSSTDYIGINWEVLRFHAENLGFAES